LRQGTTSSGAPEKAGRLPEARIFWAKLGGTSMVTVVMGAVSDGGSAGDWWETVATRPSAAGAYSWAEEVWGAFSGRRFVVRPGNVWREGFDTMASPLVASNRVTRLISRCGPPTSSQGSQKL